MGTLQFQVNPTKVLDHQSHPVHILGGESVPPSFIPAVVPVLYDVVLVRRRGEGGVEDGPDVAQGMSPQLSQI